MRRVVNHPCAHVRSTSVRRGRRRERRRATAASASTRDKVSSAVKLRHRCSISEGQSGSHHSFRTAACTARCKRWRGKRPRSQSRRTPARWPRRCHDGCIAAARSRFKASSGDFHQACVRVPVASVTPKCSSANLR
eukprot:3280547-Pyramimonas_sp.AAC.1